MYYVPPPPLENVNFDFKFILGAIKILYPVSPTWDDPGEK